MRSSKKSPPRPRPLQQQQQSPPSSPEHASPRALRSLRPAEAKLPIIARALTVVIRVCPFFKGLGAGPRPCACAPERSPHAGFASSVRYLRRAVSRVRGRLGTWSPPPWVKRLILWVREPARTRCGASIAGRKNTATGRTKRRSGGSS